MTDLSPLFSALSDKTRFEIVERLIREGELPVSQIQQAFEISPPAISRHLSVLQKAGLLDKRVNKQQRLYSVRPQAIESISAWTMSHKEFWQSSLQRLEEALLQEREK